jgi:hypothetical protein
MGVYILLHVLNQVQGFPSKATLSEMLISDVYISTWRWSYDRNM